MKRPYRSARALAVTYACMLAASVAHALTVNDFVIDFYDDPNDYLGGLGTGNIALGQNISVNFSINDFSADVTGPFLGGTEYLYFQNPNDLSGSYALNGNTLPLPLSSSIVVANNTFAQLGAGDYYLYNQFFSSPDPAFTSLAFTTVLFDATGTALGNNALFEPTSLDDWGTAFVSAQLYSAHTQSFIALMNASYSPAASAVPLPAAGWLFCTALLCLNAFRKPGASAS